MFLLEKFIIFVLSLFGIKVGSEFIWLDAINTEHRQKAFVRKCRIGKIFFERNRRTGNREFLFHVFFEYSFEDESRPCSNRCIRFREFLAMALAQKMLIKQYLNLPNFK